MESFKKNLINNISLIVVLVCTVIHLLVITLSLFNAISIPIYESFNYFVAYLMVVISLALYILGFFIEKITRLVIPSWFEILFYIAFFIFTNVYYILGLYTNIFAVVFLFIYLSVLISVINISVFYHTNKDDKNKIKITKNYILTSIFFYSTGTNAIVEFVLILIKDFFFSSSVTASIDFILVEFSSMILATIIIVVLLNLSLSSTKKLINACLIKKRAVDNSQTSITKPAKKDKRKNQAAQAAQNAQNTQNEPTTPTAAATTPTKND